MLYYIFCSTLLLLFFVCLFWTLFKDLRSAENSMQKILFCCLLTLLFKYNWGYTFCGLEYEDAYAFSFLGRQLANNIFTQSFLADCISIGSLNNPISTQQYGGHFITYSVLLSYPIRLFGFSFTLISVCTSLLCLISLLILSVFPSVKGKYSWVIAPSLYCSASIINVFGNTFLCEPFSGMLILSFVYLYDKYTVEKKSLVFPLIAFLVAIFTKRENLILFIVPVLYCVYFYIKGEKTYKTIVIHFFLFLLIIVGYILAQNVFNH